MLFSKSAITLFSSVGASSIPVISVVALYQIKHFSLGNNSEKTSSSTATEENVISLPQATSQPEEPKPNEGPKQNEAQKKVSEEGQTVLTVTEATKPKVENKSKSDNKKENSDSNTVIVSVQDSSKPIITEESIIEEEAVDSPVIKNANDLEQLTKTILENFMNQQKTQTLSDSDIAQNLGTLIDFLTKKHSTIINESEKTSAKEIIDSLTALKEKISTKK